MSEEEKFDELLSSKLSEREFPLDELNWDEAERLIIQQEKRRRVFRFAFIFSAGLLAGIALMLPFYLNSHTTLPNAVVVKTTTPQNTVNTTTAPLPVNAAKVSTTRENTTTNSTQEEKMPLPVQSAFVKKNTGTGTGGNSSNIASVTNAAKDNQGVLVAGIKKSTNKHTTKTGLIAAATNPGKKAKNIETINKDVNATDKITKASSSQPENPATNAENPATANSIDKTETNNSVNTIVTDNNNSKNSNTTNTTIPANNAEANKTIAATKTTAPTAKPDSNTANSPPPQIDAPYVSHDDNYSKNILSVYAGGNYCLGWNDNGKEANGISPWGGFNYTHYFTGNISASLGIGYSEVTNLNKTYISSIIEYDFGQTSSVTTVTPQKAYYVAFPFKLQYNLDKKDVLNIGVNYLLLLTTSSTLTTYQQNYFSQTPGTSQKQNGYTQGFSNSDIQLSLSYTRMLTNRFGITFEIYHDLDNIENSTVTGLDQSAKNNGFRLVLSYQLMK